nr:hypothetical protein [Tanacetum cinerariifolium]GEX13190.1 hypothetical protein [Tanacetum cinerariifolium]
MVLSIEGSVVIVDSVVEEIIGPDEGACLVVRRTLSNTQDREENLQREAIFIPDVPLPKGFARFIVVYFDDILVFSITEDDHQSYLQQLFEVLDQEKLYENLDKCEFFTTQVTFLGYLVSAQGIQVDEESTLVAPMTEITKLKPQAQSAFEEHKKQLSLTSFLALSLNLMHRERELWQHYLISKEFILHSDHEALKYIQGKHKLHSRHAKWVEYLYAFNFTIQHKSGKLNRGAYALSCKYTLVNSLRSRVIGLELLPQNYPSEPDFEEQFSSCQNHATGEYHICNGYLFKKNQLCISRHSIRLLLIKETHEGGLAGHLGIDKTIFFGPRWSVMWSIMFDVVCLVTKPKFTHLPMACIFHYQYMLPRGKTLALISSLVYPEHSSIMVVVDRFSKMAHFIACHTTYDVVQAEFAYNIAPNKTIGRSLFMVIYGLNPKTPLDLVVLDTSTKFNQEASDRAADIKALQQLVHDKITKSNELIKGEGPFKILTNVNDNAYKVELSETYAAAATFNVTGLQPYYDPNEPIPSLRANFLEA